MTFATFARAPVPAEPVEQVGWEPDPAAGVELRSSTALVQYGTASQPGQDGGRVDPATRPARFDRAQSIRPFGQEFAHEFTGGFIELARRPNNTPGFTQEAGSMEVHYQPAATRPLPAACPWDTTRIGTDRPAGGV